MTRQVDRMLTDPKAEAFYHSFLSQWFELHRFDDIAVNPDEYLMFDEQVRYSAREEPIRLFEHLVKENLSLTNLIVPTSPCLILCWLTFMGSGEWKARASARWSCHESPGAV